jgi:hypothetical protein
MRRFSAIIVVYLLSACPAAAQHVRPKPDTTGDTPIEIVVDRYISASAGAADLLAIQHELASLEDRVLPLKFGDERRRLPLVAGIAYRAGKLIALDVPQDHMLMVVAHEVFGHGARLRELGIGHIGYSFDAPIPYGHGGAATSFSGEVPDTPLTFLTIEMSGIEAQNVLADAIADVTLARAVVNYREAWLYFESRYIGMTYTLSATEHSEEGHDIADFIRTFKDACTPPVCTPITLRDVKRGARLTLADPLLYFALYGFTSAYIAEGKATSPIPTIPIGRGVRFLPSVGFQLAPFGTERLLRSAFTSGLRAEGKGRHVTAVTLRFGTTGASRPWGFDLRASDLHLFGRIHLRASAHVWRQPPLDSDQTSAPLKTGAAGAATLVLPLKRFTHSDWLKATFTGGYKSSGFVPGERLGRGLIFRAGVTVD